MRKQILSTFILTALTGAALPLGALGQVANPESEANDTKTAATVAASGGSGLAGTDFITGTSTGTSTTVAGLGSADYFRVKTAAAPLGIYRNRLILTSTTAGQTGTIRGLSQTGTVGAGGTIGTADNTLQTSSTTTTPPRFNQWYGFGKQEEIYYRVTGTTTTTAPYTATFESAAVSPTVIATNITAGAVTIERATGSTTDTDYWLYDANLNPIPGAGRDDGTPNATITVNLIPGTYYLAISTFNFANNQASPIGESFFGTVLDFANAVANTSTATGSNLNVKFTSPSGSFDTTGVTTIIPFEVKFLQLNVVANTALTGIGAGAPTSAPNDGASVIQFTVTVNPGQSPTSTGVAVNLNLSSIGGGGSVAALDDGLSGDSAANDNVFGAAYTVPNAQTTGTFNIPLSISDSQLRSFNGTINGITIFAVPAIVSDLGDLSQPVLATQTLDLGANEVKWYRFSLTQAVSAGAGKFLDFDTEGSVQDAGGPPLPPTDTEIGIYSAAGNLVVTDDDDGSGFRSQASFGLGTPPRAAVVDGVNGDSVLYDGRDGSLTPGTYYIAVSRFNSTFNATAFSVVGAGTGTDTGTRLNYRSTNPTNPSGIGSATPASVVNTGSGTTNLRVVVTPGNFPASTGLGVTVNAAAIGAGTVTLLDDGLNGDGAANDNTFGRTVTVVNATPAGAVSLPFTITDAQTRTGTGNIALTITAGGNPADFNNDGVVTVQDIFDFLTAYFAGSPSADFNGVGGLTVQDIFDFLAAFFAA